MYHKSFWHTDLGGLASTRSTHYAPYLRLLLHALLSRSGRSLKSTPMKKEMESDSIWSCILNFALKKNKKNKIEEVRPNEIRKHPKG